MGVCWNQAGMPWGRVPGWGRSRVAPGAWVPGGSLGGGQGKTEPSWRGYHAFSKPPWLGEYEATPLSSGLQPVSLLTSLPSPPPLPPCPAQVSVHLMGSPPQQGSGSAVSGSWPSKESKPLAQGHRAQSSASPVPWTLDRSLGGRCPAQPIRRVPKFPQSVDFVIYLGLALSQSVLIPEPRGQWTSQSRASGPRRRCGLRKAWKWAPLNR